MKSISVACAVAVTVACLCVLQSTAVPFSQGSPEPQPQAVQQMGNEVPQPEQHRAAVSAEETRPEEVLFRTKRQSHLSLCRYCCNCCNNKGCGFCCRF
ncbi:hepcidin-1 [Salminus brasiliensis]|uniref:hepcidin-1 n=1 Tax=Salminus brasiliensis TaxID=930266 RepID=UPI003B82DBDB